MPTFEQTVYVDVDLDDFDEEDLIKELEDRGFYVGKEEPDITSVEQYWNRGDKKEALILLERKFPELRGISNLVD
jgi:hypothetical protein